MERRPNGIKPRLVTGKTFQDEAQELRQKLGETTLLLEVLAYVNSLMSQRKCFEDFFIEVGKILQEKLRFRYIHIWVKDHRNPDQLELVTPETIDGFRTMSVQHGIVGKTIREGKSICLPDVRFDHDYLNVHPETKSELCLPLTSEGNVLGAINIETDTFQSFELEIPIIKVIAENLGHSMKMALLRKTEEYFQNLVEYMTEGVWVGNAKDQTLYTNPTLQKMMGFSAEELEEKMSIEYFDQKSRILVNQENAKRKKGISSHYEAGLLGKNGEHISVIVHAVPFGDGGAMATITDLRAIKSTERKLIRAERFLASITHYCPEAIVGLNEHGIIQSWNMGSEQIFGYKTNEVIGKSTEIIIPEDRIASGEFQQLLQETNKLGSVRNFETIRLHKNGKPIMTSLTLSAVKDDRENIIGLSAFYRDITSQKKWERELQDRFEKMQEAYREMGKQRRYLDYLMDMIQMAGATGITTKQIASFVVNAMIMITRVDAATLRLLDVPSGKLLLVAQNGLGEEWWGKKTIPYNNSLLENAVAEGHPLKILDILSDPRYSSPSLARKNNVRSALMIPLEAKGDILGSLTLYLSQEGNLSLLDDEFIMIFAKQAALALKLSFAKY